MPFPIVPFPSCLSLLVSFPGGLFRGVPLWVVLFRLWRFCHAIPNARADRQRFLSASEPTATIYGLLSSAITLWISSFTSVKLFITIWMSSTGLPGQRWLWQ